jgi:hypothetical protein
MCSPSQGYYRASPTPRLRALPDKAERLAKANEFINIIATHGRKFFNHEGSISYLLFDGQSRISFYDSYSKRYIYTHYNGSWRGFSNGGTMRTLIIRLREYIQGKIKTGDELLMILPIHPRSGLGGMEDLLADCNRWAYPEVDMAIVIKAARRIFSSTGETHETQDETAP